MLEFVLVSFAAMSSWEILRYLAWFRIPVRLAPVIVIIISYLWTLEMHRSLLVAFAATAGVVLLHKLSGAEGIEPLEIPDSIRTRLPVRKKRRKPPVKTSYIPTL
jgi:hypothetical protein